MKIKALDTVTAHTDGSCSGNPGPGGWGVYALTSDGTSYEFSGYEPDTTNQRMELLAGIMALAKLPADIHIHVVSDSQYLVKGMNEWLPNWKRNGWKNSSKKPVANRDLWDRLDALNQQCSVTWSWVKGHSGDPGNERADALAQEAMRNTTPYRRGS